MEKMNITNQEHDAFVKSHPNGDLLQLSKWADTKKLTGWYSRRIAVGEKGEIKGVGQLLFKKVLKLSFTLCYVSRGFVTDYSDKEALKTLVESTIEVAKTEKAYAIKIDPDVEVDKGAEALKNLRDLGFKHKGFKEGLSKDYIQPRMTMITPIDKTDDELIQSFERRNRSKVRLALKRGTKVEHANRDGLTTFAKLMKITGERDGFLTRDISYFENIYDALHSDGDAELNLSPLLFSLSILIGPITSIPLSFNLLYYFFNIICPQTHRFETLSEIILSYFSCKRNTLFFSFSNFHEFIFNI